ADMGKRMAELDHAKNRQEIRFVIASCYLDLCRLQNRQQVIDRNISLTERVIDNIKSKYSHGAALKTDITRYEL
uniref:TolC family protein n=1 Tax=uncultured Megasphaera sp. TaxID=165188 RepID=UPI00258C33FD